MGDNEDKDTPRATGRLPTSLKAMIEALNLVPHPEGCLFAETWRTGAEPMRSRGQTDFDVAPSALVMTERGARRHDGDGRRNWLSAVYYVPTRAAPVEKLSQTLSDAVYFFHGGAPFEYTVVEPGRAMTRVVLGTDVVRGQRLQLGVVGGAWTGGRLLHDERYDYCVLGKALAPAFDVNDFVQVSEDMVRRERPQLLEQLRPFLGERDGSFDEYYDDDARRARRLAERAVTGDGSGSG